MDMTSQSPGAAQASQGDTTRLSFFVLMFLIALIIPLNLPLGELRLSVYRMALLVTFIPSLFIWISGRAGRILLADLMMVLMVFWVTISHFYHFGFGASVQPVGIVTVEHLGAYLLGRCYIRSADAFYKVAKISFLLCLVLLPFAVYESMTAHNLYLSLWEKLGSVPVDVHKDPRLGLDRFQGPFDHPILPGVFATPILGLTCYVLAYQRGFVSTTVMTTVVFVTGFLCVSSGPLAALAVQLGLIVWNKVLRPLEYRWWILLGLAVSSYIIVDIISNRTPIEVAISRLALNPMTGLARVNIFNWGWVNILNNPLFGTGGGDWERYDFMTGSFDMFWLIYAMVWGLTAGVAQTAATALLIWAMIFTKMTDPRLAAYRMGWLVGIGGIIMAGWMVHFWNAPLVLYYFVLGAGVWMLEAARKPPEDAEAAPQEPETSGLRYSRFAPTAQTTRTTTRPRARATYARHPSE